MRRWRYRKVTPELLKQILELRAEGLSEAEIAERIGVDRRTVEYWVYPACREAVIERAKKRPLRKKSQEYVTQYIRDRRKGDPECRKRFMENVRKSARKRWKRIKELRALYPEYDQAYKKRLEDWQQHKQRILELRERYGVEFPF